MHARQGAQAGTEVTESLAHGSN